MSSRRAKAGTPWALVTAWTLVATPLFAQSEETAPESPEDASGPAPPADGAEEAGAEPKKTVEDDRTREARAQFLRAASLVKKAHWSEALAAFEKSAELRPHPVTSYNIGACLRALGRFVQARPHFEEALAPPDASAPALSPTLTEEAKAFLGEIDRLTATLTVELTPQNARISVDGRPLERTVKGGKRVVTLAGTMPPGPGQVAPAKVFDIRMDPGAHVITLSRKGFEDAVVNETVAPGAKERVELSISRLPATLQVDASESNAVVTVDGRDVGFAPVRVPRPGGSYKVAVYKEGFDPYETVAQVDPGEIWRVRADLEEEPPALYERWWVWAAVVGVVTTATITTYVLTRPDPQRPPAQGGGLDWVVPIP